MKNISYSFNPTFEYKGYVYGYWHDVEEDNIKCFHEVKTPEGETISMPVGPYGGVNETMFQRWIEMGMPTRKDIGGHYLPDHDAYYNKWVTEQLEKELDL